MTNQSDFYPSIDIHIRWPEGPDLVFGASPESDTVAVLKEKVLHYAR